MIADEQTHKMPSGEEEIRRDRVLLRLLRHPKIFLKLWYRSFETVQMPL